MSGCSVNIKSLSKGFGQTPVLRSVDLDIQPGEFLTLVGPSGCGKSTLLRIISGLEKQDAGTVSLAGRVVDDLPPKKRELAMVFQSYALYPHMTVFENLASPLVMQRLSFFQRMPLVGALSPGRKHLRKGIEAEIHSTAKQLNIDMLLHRKPGQLSGGQRQRVALGRAMIRKPELFLMDEPLSNLDAQLRVQMRSELASLHRTLGATFVYVTHDQVEAMTMSDRIALMIGGEIVQLGTPNEIYENPCDLRAAQFIGNTPINVLPGSVDEEGWVNLLARRLSMRIGGSPSREISIAVRPEDVTIKPFKVETVGGLLKLPSKIRHIENLGNEAIVYCEVENASVDLVAVRVAKRDLAEIVEGNASGQRVAVEFTEARIFLFDARGKRLNFQTEPVRSCAEIGRPS
ncbi:glycerol-3-phosphate ABC transporter ATP-binding protein [Rhizobium tubonense]|uniref:Glycerol-3-phosphate ABC transporter ATP-binding protein n=2 Tax=Rhizobium tubonense TaxID=484088 RepID=A0A2W4CJ88_9HYPH|nr:glycerol-3-phosphate ABC transporter ATP-binding protein [Rhizobium tubonense]